MRTKDRTRKCAHVVSAGAPWKCRFTNRRCACECACACEQLNQVCLEHKKMHTGAPGGGLWDAAASARSQAAAGGGDDSDDEPLSSKKTTPGEYYVKKWIELCESSDEIKAGAQIEYRKKVGVLKRKEDNTGKTTWVIECTRGEPHVGEEYQDPFAFAIDGEDLSYTNLRTGTSFKDERQSFAVKKLIDVEDQTAQVIATAKRRSIRYICPPRTTKTLKDLLPKSSKNSPTKMPQIRSERADSKPQAASAPGLGGAAGGKGGGGVGDGVPCSYACAFFS
jgi:hypothetical protein